MASVIRSFITIIISALVPTAAFAYESVARPWQLGFQDPASPVMEKLVWLHNHFLLYIITVITVLVLLMMIYIALRYNRKANPVPSKTTHNVKLEVIWTVIPVFILIAIAIPSLRIHHLIEDEGNAALTLKVTGYQWYWGYEYPDNGGVNFESRIVDDKDLKEGDHRLLTVDNTVVVPVNTRIRVQLTGADVIHAWAVPAFGVKRDAVPGRLNESWFEATKEGRYYGQCSELCGVKHGFMPIVVDVVSQEAFNEWIVAKGGKIAELKEELPGSPTAEQEKAAQASAPAIEKKPMGKQPTTNPSDDGKITPAKNRNVEETVNTNKKAE